MTHNRRIVIPLVVRYARWPGGDCALLEAYAEDSPIGTWLLQPCRRSSELRPYVFGRGTPAPRGT